MTKQLSKIEFKILKSEHLKKNSTKKLIVE